MGFNLVLGVSDTFVRDFPSLGFFLGCLVRSPGRVVDDNDNARGKSRVG
jgi:hypothetical protein